LQNGLRNAKKIRTPYFQCKEVILTLKCFHGYHCILENIHIYFMFKIIYGLNFFSFSFINIVVKENYIKMELNNSMIVSLALVV